MGSKYDRDDRVIGDQPRWTMGGPASGATYFDRDDRYFTTNNTNLMPTEAPKPAADLTNLLAQVDTLVQGNPELAEQFQNFLDKYTEDIELDFDIG